MVIPEADRDVKKGHIYYEKKRAIAAIPVIDEDGKTVEPIETEQPLVKSHNSPPKLLSASEFLKNNENFALMIGGVPGYSEKQFG